MPRSGAVSGLSAAAASSTSTPIAAAAAKPHLTYFGGPVLSHVKIVGVVWGSGTYQPQVTATTTPNVSGFLGGLANSAYMDLSLIHI